MTIPLDVLCSTACNRDTTTQVSTHVAFFDVLRSAVGGSPQVCIVKTSLLSTTLKVLDVVSGANHQPSVLVTVRDFYIPCETYSARLLSQTRLAAAVKGNFEIVDLTTLETQNLFDPSDPALEFARRKKVKPLALFRVSSSLFLVCCNKFGFYIHHTGYLVRDRSLMWWDTTAVAFALQQPHLLVFGASQTEVWNIETADSVQTMRGKYTLLNTPDARGKILALSDTIVQLVITEPSSNS
ncbi:citron-like protein [Mycena sp. CBHHK59/15]|nr:citron-like protein [Mycena sp. CBHHK59/15]